MHFKDEFFGTAAQVSVSRRARDAWKLIQDDPRYAYNGRIVTMVGFIENETPGKLAALARLQGSTTCHFLPKDQVSDTEKLLEGEGLACNVWEFCKGGLDTYRSAQRVLSTHQLPPDIILTEGSTQSSVRVDRFRIELVYRP